MADTDGTFNSCPINQVTMLMAMRINPANPDVQLLMEKVYTLNTAANTNYRWVLYHNPTITGGTPNWVDVGASPVQIWIGTGASTLSGGTQIDAGYASRDFRATVASSNPSVNPGVAINGTPDIMALGIESFSGTSTCAGGIGIRQLV